MIMSSTAMSMNPAADGARGLGVARDRSLDLSRARFVFVGNRFFVLEEMLAAGLRLERILAVKGSYLERELAARGVAHAPIASKADLLRHLREASFDALVANGCPYVLPADEVGRPDRRFINVHPSYLPDLRGADPVPGALLFGRDSGATCHIMDARIDTGDIISQVRVPYSEDLDAGLLYRLSFRAERQVFRAALERAFAPAYPQPADSGSVYYTRKPGDLRIDFAEPAAAIVRRVRAFNNPSQGAFFTVGAATIKVFAAELAANRYLVAESEGRAENEVLWLYEGSLVIKKGAACLKLGGLTGDLAALSVGVVLS